MPLEALDHSIVAMEQSMTAFLVGVALALTPSVLFVAWMLWRSTSYRVESK